MKNIIKDFVNFEDTKTGYEVYSLSNDELGIYETKNKDLLDFVTVIDFPHPNGELVFPKLNKKVLEEYNGTLTLDSQTHQKVMVNVHHKHFVGNLFFSRETVEDFPEMVNSFVISKVKELCRKTRNKEIGKLLKQATLHTINDFDSLKELINSFNPEKNTTLVISQSFYNELETLKYNNGEYIFKSNKKEKTTNDLFVDNVLVVSDETIGEKGEKSAFFGELESYIMLFERNKNILKLVTNQYTLAEELQVGTQFNVQKFNEENGLFIKWNN